MVNGHRPSMRVIGLSGWSGAGKTTLLDRLIPALIARGLRISTLKHAHHEFDIDRPETDSWRLRQAGAREVLTVAPERWALQRELSGEPEPPLPTLLGRMAQVDVVLIEGFKRAAHPKIEIHRLANGKPPLHPDDPTIVAVVSDAAFPGLTLPLLHLDDITGVADIVQSCARPMDGIDWR